MKKILLTFCFIIISSSSFAGSCPMLWNKIDSEISKVTDESLKAKIQQLRIAGENAHSDGDHADSEKLLNEALDLINS
tara:strand:- start:470 stop:703 length:234 start_codon:yes stop_codon:yes gene_type:complete